MITLLKGKVSSKKIGGSSSLYVDQLFSWINKLFESKDEKYHTLGQQGIESLLLFNNKDNNFIETVIMRW